MNGTPAVWHAEPDVPVDGRRRVNGHGPRVVLLARAGCRAARLRAASCRRNDDARRRRGTGPGHPGGDGAPHGAVGHGPVRVLVRAHRGPPRTEPPACPQPEPHRQRRGQRAAVRRRRRHVAELPDDALLGLQHQRLLGVHPDHERLVGAAQARPPGGRPDRAPRLRRARDRVRPLDRAGGRCGPRAGRARPGGGPGHARCGRARRQRGGTAGGPRQPVGTPTGRARGGRRSAPRVPRPRGRPGGGAVAPALARHDRLRPAPGAAAVGLSARRWAPSSARSSCWRRTPWTG